MKQLFWKECYELRFLPLGAALAVAVFLAGVKAYCLWLGHTFPLSMSLLWILDGVWLLFAVLSGAGTISQETGTGTLQFLSSLPLNRRSIWWVKAIVSLGMLLLSMLASVLTWLILCEVWCSDKSMINSTELRHLLGLTQPIIPSAFVISLAVSTFFDRPLSVAVVSILVALGLLDLSGNLAVWYSDSNSDAVLFSLVGLSIPTFAAISYWTFTRGETLRGRKRFIVAGITGGVCVGISLVILATASAFGAWN